VAENTYTCASMQVLAFTVTVSVPNREAVSLLPGAVSRKEGVMSRGCPASLPCESDSRSTSKEGSHQSSMPQLEPSMIDKNISFGVGFHFPDRIRKDQTHFSRQAEQGSMSRFSRPNGHCSSAS
jgi:hypothetical protein